MQRQPPQLRRKILFLAQNNLPPSIFQHFIAVPGFFSYTELGIHPLRKVYGYGFLPEND
jgi:hypothetical protein